MKLTLKDKEFLEKLKGLYDREDLQIRFVYGPPSYLKLCGNYGAQIENEFGMSRQGVRWRFHRLFNDIYVSAYEAIYWVESNFGTSLRKDVMSIVKERVGIRKKYSNLSKHDFIDNKMSRA